MLKREGNMNIWINRALTLSICSIFISHLISSKPTSALEDTSKAQAKPSSLWKTLNGQPPILIAHRGEKTLAPENTILSYKFGAILGADYVEPDLVLTKDHQFVCYHDIYLGPETDVASHPEFANLSSSAAGENAGKRKWAVRDFTVEQLQTLRLSQPNNIGLRPQETDGLFTIPTFKEFLDAIHEIIEKRQQQQSQSQSQTQTQKKAIKRSSPPGQDPGPGPDQEKPHNNNNVVGIIPEIVQPKYHNEHEELNTPNYVEDLLLTILAEYGYAVTENHEENCELREPPFTKIKCPHVIIQSFELPTLAYLKNTSNLDLMALVYDDPRRLTHKGVADLAAVAKYYGVWKEFLIMNTKDFLKTLNVVFVPNDIYAHNGFIPPSQLVSIVHKNGMKLIISTIYDSHEPTRSHCLKYEAGNTGKCEKVAGKKDEMFHYFDAGVDGMFIEGLSEAREILREKYFEIECAKKLHNLTEPEHKQKDVDSDGNGDGDHIQPEEEKPKSYIPQNKTKPIIAARRSQPQEPRKSETIPNNEVTDIPHNSSISDEYQDDPPTLNPHNAPENILHPADANPHNGGHQFNPQDQPLVNQPVIGDGLNSNNNPHSNDHGSQMPHQNDWGTGLNSGPGPGHHQPVQSPTHDNNPSNFQGNPQQSSSQHQRVQSPAGINPGPFPTGPFNQFQQILANPFSNFNIPIPKLPMQNQMPFFPNFGRR